MISPPNAPAKELGGAILKSVSRSFYISVRLLPKRLREPVGLAYLLARATDTVADTTEIPAAFRKEALGVLSSAIQGSASADGIVELETKFAALQNNNAERTLIQSLGKCLQL